MLRLRMVWSWCQRIACRLNSTSCRRFLSSEGEVFGVLKTTASRLAARHWASWAGVLPYLSPSFIPPVGFVEIEARGIPLIRRHIGCDHRVQYRLVLVTLLSYLIDEREGKFKQTDLVFWGNEKPFLTVLSVRFHRRMRGNSRSIFSKVRVPSLNLRMPRIYNGRTIGG